MKRVKCKLFKIEIDGDMIAIRLFKRLFGESTYRDTILYHDLGIQEELTELHDSLREAGQLENLFRLAKGFGDIEMTLISGPAFNNKTIKTKGSSYYCEIVICHKCQIRYDTLDESWYPFNSRKILSTVEQIEERNIPPEKRYKH